MSTVSAATTATTMGYDNNSDMLVAAVMATATTKTAVAGTSKVTVTDSFDVGSGDDDGSDDGGGNGNG